MPTLAPNSLAAFRDRFNSADDGLLRHVAIDLGTPTRRPSATLTISTQDREAADKSGWSNLTLRIDGLEELHLQQLPNTDSQFLSNGVHILFADQKVFIDLGPFTDEKSTIADYRNSDFYVAGAQATWNIEPYGE